MAESPKVVLKIEPIVDLNKQSVEIPGEDLARVSALVGENGELKRSQFDDVTTLYEGFRRGLAQSNDGDCLGYRETVHQNGSTDQTKQTSTAGPYRWISYGDVVHRSEYMARGFLKKGLSPGQSTCVGLYCQNRPEWVITEQACYYYSMVVVPLYDTLGPDACSYIISQAEIQLVLVDTAQKAESLLNRRADCPSLRVLVLLEPANSTLTSSAVEAGVDVVSFDEIEQLGERSDDSPSAVPPTPDDLSTISYTSGTTGAPKGVMLTHGNIVADCSVLTVLKYSMFTPTDTHISYLPLAHVFERIMQALIFMTGGKVGFFRGDIRLLTEDMKELRPTIVPVVPRVVNRIYDRVMQEANKSFIKSFLFNWAIRAKTNDVKSMIVRNNSMWDEYVFKRVRESMGGRVRLMITGSAPVSAEVLNFMRVAMGCIVLEGYGQTECVGACCLTLEGDSNPGHVGPPVPCCKVKLVDVPDMNYLAKDGVGEICVKGYNVFRGYYKDREKTEEALDSDGWLHTGDIGRWIPQGALKIIDRKKHIFKLSQGEYIAPEKIENVYLRSKFVSQIYIHGESLKSSLVAIVSPDPEVLTRHAETQLGMNTTFEEICKHETVKKLILSDLNAEGKKAGLQSFEQVKDIYLFPEPFTMEAGMLTPTMKSKRPAMRDYFKEQIDKMYSTLD